MKKLLFLCVVLLAYIFVRAENAAVGQWAGLLDFGLQKLNVITEFSEKGGKFSGVFYSIDQSSQAIPMSKTAFDGKKLEFEINSLSIKFSGTLSDGKISGVFSQRGMKVPLNMTKNITPVVVADKTFAIPAETLDKILGKWEGVLKVNPASKLRLELNFAKDGDGRCIGYLVSPDQSPAHIRATKIEGEDSFVKVEFSSIGALFDLKVAKNLSGTFKQGQLKQTISLEKKQ